MQFLSQRFDELRQLALQHGEAGGLAQRRAVHVQALVDLDLQAVASGGRLATITGDIYASLWYPVTFTVIPILVSLFFLKETKGKRLEDV